MLAELPGGFRSLWLRFDENYTADRLFYKEHSVRNQDAKYPRGHTLFIPSIPPWATSDSLSAAFAKICGPVDSVTLTVPPGESSKIGCTAAFIVFRKESGLDKALALPSSTTLTLHSEDNPGVVGIQKWCKEYNESATISEAKLRRDIEKYMRDYDERVAERQARGEDENEEEDGWVTVTSKKKRGQFAPARKESTINKLQSKEERKGGKELQNFYTFQIREAKKQNLVKLRKKFENDKKKIQQLKLKRSFKPYS